MTSPEPGAPWEGEERVAYLALALIPGVGPGRMRDLIQSCGSPSGALTAPLAFLEAVPEMKGAPAAAVHIARGSTRGTGCSDDLRRVGRSASAAGRRAVSRWRCSRWIHRRCCSSHSAGSISCRTLGGRDRRESRSHPLRRRGLRGPGRRRGGGGTRGRQRDGARARCGGASRRAGRGRRLDRRPRERPGCGLPRVQSAPLHPDVADGLLLTEAPPGERPFKGAFPKRNRLIAGLARATVVIEAAVGAAR